VASFNVVNYSLRPSKGIQRQIVFDGIRTLLTRLGLKDVVYVGFGSIWFTDFIMAHKMLSIDEMISIEKDEIGYARARFNAPFATVDVRRGASSEILPVICGDSELNARPWILWLDYDRCFEEDIGDDIRLVVERAPENTIVLATFNGSEGKYGVANERPERLRELFEGVVPTNLSKNQCKEDRMQRTLVELGRKYMTSIALEARRPGGFVPAVEIIYQDTAPMVTIGGVLPSVANKQIAQSAVNAGGWRCRPAKPIRAPHLTMREAIALQSMLPDPVGMSRSVVKALGFDLDESEIEVYGRYYKEYPAFAEVVT